MEDFDCDDFEKTLKVIVVGNGNVGKTSMTTRYAKGKYTGTYKKTIGVDFMEKTVELRDLGETINLMIWDTAGQEEFDTLTSRYYKGAGAVIYVFSTVDRASFDDLPKWRRKVEEECGQICSVLVQNKIDLEDDAAMTRDEVEDMADHLNMRLYRACVQDNVNVGEVFRYLCRRFLKSGDDGDDGDEMVHAVTDISTLSQTVKATEMSRHTSSPEPRAKREISDISDIESDRTSTAAPSPTSQSHLGRSFPPSPPTITDREYDSDSGDEAERDSPRRNRKNDNDSGDVRKQIKRRSSSRRASNEEERDIARETEESPRRAPSGREYEFEDEGDDDDDEEGVNSSDAPKLQPSKRRTNGKKTHPPPDCVIS